jgi:GDP-4-dehydro-6-deoxy-D-mannose reductase
MRPVDTPKIEADISKIKTEIGWQPKLSVDDTIADVLDWWRKVVNER